MDRHPEDAGVSGGRFHLEGYRAVAAVTVVVFHAYQHNRYGSDWRWPLQDTPWHGVLMATDMLVDMFFVLSGFLLTLPYARAAFGDREPTPARAFLIRRAVRLLPLYFIVVLVVWALSNPVLPGDWRDLVLHLTFTHVWSDEKIFYTDGPAWTLGVEAHFYVLLAILGALAQWGCARLRSRRARLAVLLGGIGLLIALSVGYKLWAFYVRHYPVDSWSVWFGPPAKLDVLAIGMLLAVLWAAGLRWPNRSVRSVVGLSGIGVIGLGLWLPGQGMPETFAHTFYALGMTMLIGATALSLEDGPRWLRWPPLVSLSLTSYSLYLWHEPVLRVLDGAGLLPETGSPLAFPLTALVLVGASIPVSYLSYWVIESTARKINAAFDRRGRPRDYYQPLPERG